MEKKKKVFIIFLVLLLSCLVPMAYAAIFDGKSGMLFWEMRPASYPMLDP